MMPTGETGAWREPSPATGAVYDVIMSDLRMPEIEECVYAQLRQTTRAVRGDLLTGEYEADSQAFLAGGQPGCAALTNHGTPPRYEEILYSAAWRRSSTEGRSARTDRSAPVEPGLRRGVPCWRRADLSAEASPCG